MACRITLPVWPSTLNCISWSKDNLIAVAAGEQVAVLSPRLKEPGPDGTHWDVAIFKANEFNAEEVPIVEPLSYRNFSLGEELSLRQVHALEWSPPGLAKFGHCVLAVLNTSHILSLWECDGRPNIDSNWKRKVIVNHALKTHYAQLSSALSSERTEKFQVQQRVRAFAWAPPVSQQGFSGNIRSNQILAISTEGGDIHILRVESPYDILQPRSKSSNITILQTLAIADLQNADRANGLANGHSSRPNLVANHLAWSDFRREPDDEYYCAQLAYAADGHLSYLTFRVDLLTQNSQVDVIRDYQRKSVLISASDVHGPLKFAPGTTLLVAFSPDRVYCVDTAAVQTEDNIITSHHLDDRWDEISGLTFTQTSSGKSSVHITSHLSTASAKTAVLSLPIDGNAVSATPLWQRAINAENFNFSDVHALAGQVAERVWGIASSPLGEYIVTAVISLPADCVAYTTLSEQKTILNITHETSLDGQWKMSTDVQSNAFPGSTVETMLFSSQRLLDRLPSSEESDLAVQGMMKLFETSIANVCSTESAKEILEVESHRQILDLRQKINMHPEIRIERSKFLANFASKKIYSVGPVLFKAVLERLLKSVLDSPADSAAGGAFSSKIRAHYATITSKLSPMDPGVSKPETNAENSAEECRICRKAIPFESLKWARCESGHRFSRCMLTFFAIQEPGVSKRCTICDMQYLNEWFITEMADVIDSEDAGMTQASTAADGHEAESVIKQDAHGIPVRTDNQESSTGDWAHVSHGHSNEPTSSLARTLFAAFETCIYCGATFFT